MNKKYFVLIFIVVISTTNCLLGVVPELSKYIQSSGNSNDTVKESQILYNGRDWRNKYYRVKGDQFLFSNWFLEGSVSINGKSFKNLSIRYDILNDEIHTIADKVVILQLNKEKVDSFNMVSENVTYRFEKVKKDTLTGLNGFVNVLYHGKSALYVKYVKEIQPLAVENKYDKFLQSHKIYILKNGILYKIAGKGDLLRVLSEDKIQIKKFIKQNELTVSRKIPESFVPVIRYYDGLSK
jgi:hypothetical protein